MDCQRCPSSSCLVDALPWATRRSPAALSHQQPPRSLPRAGQTKHLQVTRERGGDCRIWGIGPGSRGERGDISTMCPPGASRNRRGLDDFLLRIWTPLPQYHESDKGHETNHGNNFGWTKVTAAWPSSRDSRASTAWDQHTIVSISQFFATHVGHVRGRTTWKFLRQIAAYGVAPLLAALWRRILLDPPPDKDNPKIRPVRSEHRIVSEVVRSPLWKPFLRHLFLNLKQWSRQQTRTCALDHGDGYVTLM